MRDPQTDQEWQEAVDGAEVMLLIDSAKQYGLVRTNITVNISRCFEILEAGRQRGFHPAADCVERALTVVERVR